MTSATALDAENIEMRLGHGAARVHALKGVSLKLLTGQLTLLIGPSGSGKSTLLSIMGCILKPSSGSIRVAGSSTDKLDSERLSELRRRHIGFVFQSYNLFPGLTALENVRTGLAIRGRTTTNTLLAARAALEKVGLGNRLQTLPGQLSGGEQQRVAIARAMVGDPAIILADEPTAALDGTAGSNVLEQLRRLAVQEKRAVLVVSHDARALPFAQRVVTLEDGLIQKSRSEKIRDPLLAEPAHA